MIPAGRHAFDACGPESCEADGSGEPKAERPHTLTAVLSWNSRKGLRRQPESGVRLDGVVSYKPGHIGHGVARRSGRPTKEKQPESGTG